MSTNSLQLKQASFDGDIDTVRQLLDAGADPNSTDEYGSGTLLTFHPKVIQFLLARGADPDIQTNKMGRPVLIGLTHGDHLECVRLLLESGANPNRACAVTGETALHGAVTNKELDRTQIVKLLLDHGADPNAKTKPGVTSETFWRDARTRSETPLHRAAAYLPMHIIEMLITAGADTTIRDINGDSPLSWASWHLRSRDIIDLLNVDKNGNKIA
ncbi:ankyrin repeat domain-containing protein [Thalassoglobus sp.]|uniref:ankyrin repeat domain-containing protein n=1 Tax=Thalassoglobus sp. TaxID=2795869 RepID=UPI003AA86230